MKKNFKIVSILAVVIFCAVAFLNFTVYRHNAKNNISDKENTIEKISKVEVDESTEKSCCQNEEAVPFSENSIYQLDAEWANQSNKKFELSELRGNTVLLTMFFADCAYACPTLVNDIKRIEKFVGQENSKNFKYVLVSFNPDRDTPEVLKQYAIDHKLDLKKWTLLNGSDENIMELAVLLGVKYKKINDRNFSHSNVITLLNSSGEIAFQQTGLNQDLTKISEVINKIN